MNLETKNTMLALAVCFAALHADAKQRAFHFPVEAHWGGVLLRPGDYAIEVPSASSWPERVVVLQRGKAVANIFPLTEESPAQLERSYLRLVSDGKEYFVRTYTSAATGKRFTFTVPKAVALRHETKKRY